MMTDYTPVDCAVYSEYEIAILQHRRLRISWCQPDGQLSTQVLRPLDLRTRDHEEFLFGETPDGKTLQLRLDQITKTERL